MLLLHDGKGREELYEASGSKPVQFLTPHDSVTVANSGNLMAYSSGNIVQQHLNFSTYVML